MTTIESLKAQLKEKRENAAYLRDLFESHLGFTPPEQQFMVWLNRFGVEMCSDAIERTSEWMLLNQKNVKDPKLSPKIRESLQKTEEDVCSYATGVMYKMKAKEEETAEKAKERAKQFSEQTSSAKEWGKK